MRFRHNEKAKLDTRRKLWKTMKWFWIAGKDDSGKTITTNDENKSNGYGFFKKNHSISCTDHAVCRAELHAKKLKIRKERRKNKRELKNYFS